MDLLSPLIIAPLLLLACYAVSKYQTQNLQFHYKPGKINDDLFKSTNL